MNPLRHVVAGTDFSPAADHALQFAVGLALGAAARLTVVHVCELGVDDDEQRILRRCDEQLARVVAAHRVDDLALSAVLRSGCPWQKLDNVAIEVGARLVVIGRHGAGRGTRIPIGSVAEQLARCASRPVLTVPFHFDGLAHEARESNFLPAKKG